MGEVKAGTSGLGETGKGLLAWAGTGAVGVLRDPRGGEGMTTGSRLLSLQTF